jgi:hypothetical protein
VTGHDESPRAQLAALNVLVRSLQTDVQECKDQVRDLSGTSPEDHTAEHQDLRDRLERLIGYFADQPAPIHLPDLEPDDRAQRESDLRKWVRDVLGAWPVGQHLAAKDCWWNHLDIRWHVNAAWLAWIGAYRVTPRRHDAADAWCRVTVPALTTAVNEALGDQYAHCDKPHPLPKPPGQS